MTYGHGLALVVIGCLVTVTGLFISFLIYNYNQKEELKKMKLKKELKKNPYYFGDDTVWYL